MYKLEPGPWQFLDVANQLVVYFAQLSGTERTRKLVENIFWPFQPFLFISNVFQ